MTREQSSDVRKVLEQLVAEVAQYAERKGESWRLGEGTEIMDAMQAAGEVLTGNPSPSIKATLHDAGRLKPLPYVDDSEPSPTGAAAEVKKYKHFVTCNGDRRVPAGEPGHCCSCFNSIHALAAQKEAPTGLREAIEQGIEFARALRGEAAPVVNAKHILTINILSFVQSFLEREAQKEALDKQKEMARHSGRQGVLLTLVRILKQQGYSLPGHPEDDVTGFVGGEEALVNILTGYLAQKEAPDAVWDAAVEACAKEVWRDWKRPIAELQSGWVCGEIEHRIRALKGVRPASQTEEDK